MSDSNEYTLLIVESPVIAHRIQTLQIPWLEVIATEGFCWHPKFNPSKGILTKKADPGKRKIRKKIKEKEPWAVRTVIATDADASGDFIAWTIAGFLGKERVQRCYLNLLTETAVIKSIETSFDMPADSLKNMLEKQFLVYHLWKKYVRVPAADLLASSLFLKKNLPFNAFKARSGNLFYSYESVFTSFNSTYKCSKPCKGYRLASPPSFYDILDALALEDIGLGFEQISGKLFELFTARLNGKLLNTISYPRTTSNGFYHATWDAIEKNRIMERELEGLRPPSVRDILRNDTAHESLRPAGLQTDPASMRGRLKPDLYNIYSVICSHFADSITCPSGRFQRINDLGNRSIWPHEHPQPENITEVTSTWTIGTAGKVLSDLGVVRPSTYGKLLDKWIFEHKLDIDGPVLSPDKFNATDPDRANMGFLLMQACREIIIDPGEPKESIRNVFRQYLESG